MPVATWPASLPQRPLAADYRQGLGDTVHRTEMDVGPKKQRRRATAAPQPLTWSMNVTDTQLQVFIDFHNDDLLAGTLPFWLPSPRAPENNLLVRLTDEVDWAASPALGSDGKMRRVVTLALEILP